MELDLSKMTKAEVTENPTKSYYARGGVDGWFGYPSAILDNAPVFTWLDVPRMLRDERVQFGLRMLKAPFQQVKFAVKSDDKAVAQFVFKTTKKFWSRFVNRILSRYFKWGCCPIGLEYAIEEDKAVLKYCRMIEPRDARPLEYKNGPHKHEFGGFRFNNNLATRPHAMWFVGEGELDKYHDRPRIAGAFEPWLEKRGRTGAVHSRRLYARTCAFRRDGIRFPNRMVNVGTDDQPVLVHGQVLARQVAETIETGSIPILPNSPNPGMTGEYEWEIIETQARQNLTGVMEYPHMLDKEIDTGLGIPTEVVEAADVGSGWSGRMIPARAFYGSLDEIVGNLLDCFDRDCLRYLVALNFGIVRYEVSAKPLADQVFEGNTPADIKRDGERAEEKKPNLKEEAQWVPYQGQQGGMGKKNLVTGRITYEGETAGGGGNFSAIHKAFDESRLNRVAKRARG